MSTGLVFRYFLSPVLPFFPLRAEQNFILYKASHYVERDRLAKRCIFCLPHNQLHEVSKLVRLDGHIIYHTWYRKLSCVLFMGSCPDLKAEYLTCICNFCLPYKQCIYSPFHFLFHFRQLFPKVNIDTFI